MYFIILTNVIQLAIIFVLCLDLRWFHKVVWILFEVSVGVAIIITVAYWSLLEVRFSSFSINNHLINTVIMLLELFVNRIPIRILHFYNLFFFSIIYVVFSLILHATGFSSAIYPILDWEQNWRLALGLALFIILLVSPVVHFTVYGLYVIRKILAFRLNKTSNSPSKNSRATDSETTNNSVCKKNDYSGEINPACHI